MKLTELDKRIIQELDDNSRQSLSMIARKLKTSEQRVKYRFELLIEQGIINEFISFIDVTKLGYMAYRVYFQYYKVSPEKEKEIVEYLTQNPNVQWMASFSGTWDLEIVFFAKNFFHYYAMINEILEKYGEYIARKSLSVSVNNYYFKRRYLSDERRPQRVMQIEGYGGEPVTHSLDKVDVKILETLSNNARASLSDIATPLDITSNCIKDRIRRLREKGILQEQTVVLSSEKMGRQFYKILIQMRKFDNDIESRIISFCDKFKNIWFFIVCDGEWNIEFEVEVKENEELRTLIREFRNEFQDLVLRYDSLFAYKINKMRYFPADLSKMK